jgi:hypothetical protein
VSAVSILRVSAAVALAAAIFAFSWLYRFNDPGGAFAFLTDDHFFYVVRGWQILFGELPVRDFVDHGAPLHFYVGAAVQTLFGRGTLSELVFSVTALAIGAVGVFFLAARASGSLILGAAAAAIHILLGPRFYSYPKILVYVAAIPVLWAWIASPAARWTATIAVVTAIGFLFRHDHALFVAGAFGFLLLSVRSVPWRQRLRSGATYVVGVSLLLAPYLVFVQLNGGLGMYFRAAVTWAAHDRDRAEVVWPGLFDHPEGVSAAAVTGNLVSRAVAVVRDNDVAWLFYSELLLPVVALALVALARTAFRPDWPHASAKVAVVAVLGILLNAGFLRSPLEARIADPSIPHAVLLAWLPVALTGVVRQWVHGRRAGNRGSIGRAAAGAICVVVAMSVLMVVLLTITRGLPRRLEVTQLDRNPEHAINRAEEIWHRVSRAFPVGGEDSDASSLMMLASYLRQCTRPDDRVFMQHYLPQVTALGERGFAGGHADLRPGFFTSHEMQQLTVDRLRRQSVPVVLLDIGDSPGGFRDSFPLVMAYFDRHYAVAAEHVFDDRYEIRLLVRRDRKRTGELHPLGWPCFG